MVFRSQVIKSRISFVVFFFILLWLSLFVRSAYLQLIPHQKLSELQNKLFDRTVVLKPRRGSIYDRKNKELAISIPSQSLFADPSQMEEPYFAAKKLSRLFPPSQKSYLKKLLNKKRRFVWIKRHLSEKEVLTVKSWKLKGLYFLKENKRFYTNGNSLSQVLGFTGSEGQGLEGIEKQYDEVLKGEPQKVLIQRDARGRPLFMDFSPFITKVSGYDAHLTIDSDLQFYLEKTLLKGIKKSQAESGVGILLSAQNSEILAMANMPNYNPNQASLSSADQRRNRAITDIFEPGSTMKTFTIISALKKGISPTKLYGTKGGELEIDSHIIREAEKKKQFKAFLNMPEILSLSSNVGISSIALELGAKNLRKNLIHFGFGQKTGVDFPGEGKGVLKELPWRDIETATISFGHGIATTALQIANAYASIANGGFLKQPLLVKKIKNPYTGEEKVFQAQTVRQVLSKKTAQNLSFLLTNVTEKETGTGTLAKVPGYLVAGKTGTAQKVDLENNGYKEGEYISSFVGFIPAHKPQFVIYLMIDGAKNNFYASQLTAPLFAEVASYVVRQAGLSPTLLKKENMLSERLPAGASIKILPTEETTQKISSQKKQKKNKTWFQNLLTKKLKGKTSSQNLRVKKEDQKNHQNPELKSELLTMPDLKGLSLKESLQQLRGYDLNLKIKGSGYLIESQPSGGEILSKNQKITLKFSYLL